MKPLHLIGLSMLIALAACSNDAPRSPQAMPGSDRDAHGCIPSAGYAWCAKTDRCERPWELAKEHAFENAPEAFEAFCRVPEQDAPRPSSQGAPSDPVVRG